MVSGFEIKFAVIIAWKINKNENDVTFKCIYYRSVFKLCFEMLLKSFKTFKN